MAELILVDRPHYLVVGRLVRLTLHTPQIISKFSHRASVISSLSKLWPTTVNYFRRVQVKVAKQLKVFKKTLYSVKKQLKVQLRPLLGPIKCGNV